MSDLAREYSMEKSIISTILKNKEAVKSSDVAMGVSAISKQRLQVLEEVEKLLMIFINEKQLAGDSFSEEMICAKGLEMYNDLLKKDPSLIVEGSDFKASRGWFEKFKRRSGIHNMV